MGDVARDGDLLLSIQLNATMKRLTHRDHLTAVSELASVQISFVIRKVFMGSLNSVELQGDIGGNVIQW